MSVRHRLLCYSSAHPHYETLPVMTGESTCYSHCTATLLIKPPLTKIVSGPQRTTQRTTTNAIDNDLTTCQHSKSLIFAVNLPARVSSQSTCRLSPYQVALHTNSSHSPPAGRAMGQEDSAVHINPQQPPSVPASTYHHQVFEMQFFQPAAFVVAFFVLALPSLAAPCVIFDSLRIVERLLTCASSIFLIFFLEHPTTDLVYATTPELSVTSQGYSSAVSLSNGTPFHELE